MGWNFDEMSSTEISIYQPYLPCQFEWYIYWQFSRSLSIFLHINTPQHYTHPRYALILVLTQFSSESVGISFVQFQKSW